MAHAKALIHSELSYVCISESKVDPCPADYQVPLTGIDIPKRGLLEPS